MSQVKKDDNVKVHYTGKLSNGEVFDTSEGKDPIAFQVGNGQMIPGFEKEVLDMELNEKKTFTIQPADAYGEPRKELIQEVPKSQLPPEIKPEIGMRLVSKTPEGQEIPLVITEVKEENITVDANHPLAGKELTFEIEIVEIN